MKTSILMSANNDRLLLARVVQILAWQGVSPEIFSSQQVDGDMRLIRVEVDCSPWLLQRLIVHWNGIQGVRSVLASPQDELAVFELDHQLAPAK